MSFKEFAEKSMEENISISIWADIKSALSNAGIDASVDVDIKPGTKSLAFKHRDKKFYVVAEESE